MQQCITTTRFWVPINYSPHRKFKLTRGLRHGDPLSPALFILVSELLSRLMLKEEANGTLRSIKICRGAPLISHLLFAKASPCEAETMSYLGKIYGVVWLENQQAKFVDPFQQKLHGAID